jgi:hypothetical protein
VRYDVEIYVDPRPSNVDVSWGLERYIAPRPWTVDVSCADEI